MNEEINVLLLGENALDHVLRQKRSSYHLIAALCSNLSRAVAVTQ